MISIEPSALQDLFGKVFARRANLAEIDTLIAWLNGNRAALEAHPAPPPSVLGGGGDDFRSDAVALARLVLKSTTSTSDVVEMERLARKLAGEPE